MCVTSYLWTIVDFRDKFVADDFVLVAFFVLICRSTKRRSGIVSSLAQDRSCIFKPCSSERKECKGSDVLFGQHVAVGCKCQTRAHRCYFCFQTWCRVVLHAEAEAKVDLRESGRCVSAISMQVKIVRGSDLQREIIQTLFLHDPTDTKRILI